MLNGDMELFMNLTNGEPFPNPFDRRRMLAEDSVGIQTVDDNDPGALGAGEDNQLEETELDDISVVVTDNTTLVRQL